MEKKNEFKIIIKAPTLFSTAVAPLHVLRTYVILCKCAGPLPDGKINAVEKNIIIIIKKGLQECQLI